MTVIEIQSNYLKANELIEQGISQVTIVSEGSMIEREYDGEKVTRCELEVETGKGIKVWSQNKTSTNQLVKLFGKESKDWIGKKVELQFVSVSGSDKKSIQVDELRTKQIN